MNPSDFIVTTDYFDRLEEEHKLKKLERQSTRKIIWKLALYFSLLGLVISLIQ